MYRKVVIFLDGGKHCKGPAWKAGARWRFLNTAVRAEELAKHGAAHWEGETDEILRQGRTLWHLCTA